MVSSEHANGSFMLYITFEQRDIHHLRIFFFRLPFSVTPIRILPVNKRQIILDEFNLFQNFRLNTQKSISATSTRPLGKVGGQSPLQLSSQTHFAKIED